MIVLKGFQKQYGRAVGTVPLLCVLIGLPLLSACSGMTEAKPPGSFFGEKAMRLEQQAQQDMQSNTFVAAIENYKQAHRIYALRDDRQGRLRTHLALAHLYYLHEKPDAARQNAQQALKIAQSLPEQPEFFRIHLLLGKIKTMPDHFQQALEHAKTPLEKAMALVYLERVEEGWQRIQNEKPVSHLGDHAFVWFAYGKRLKQEKAVQHALALYKKSDDFHGVSNALYLLARISLSHGDRNRAKDYFERALAVNKALGQPQRILAIEAALRSINDATAMEPAQ